MPIDFPSRKAALWTGALILLMAFGLRAHRLAYDSVWWDEGYSVWMSRQPIPDMLWQTAHDAHPPLSYAMLHGWIALVGNEEFALRMQSVLFGVLTAAAAYQIGRVAGDRRAALMGMLLVAVMRLPVWWSQEIRMYAPATLFAALALWAALKLFTTRHRLWPWALMLALSLGAGLLTLYLFAGAVLALNIAFLYVFAVSARRWRLAAAWIASQVGALLLFMPWLLYAINYLPSWETPYAPVTFLHVIKLYLSSVFLGLGSDLDRNAPLLILAAIILIAAAGLAVWNAPRQKRVVWATLLIGALLPPITVFLTSLPRGAGNYPTPDPRYFVPLSTAVYVLIGWGVASPIARNSVRKWAGALILAPLLGIAVWSLAIYYPGLRLSDDYASMVATLQALRQDGDAVVLNNDTDWPIFDYHYNADYARPILQNELVLDNAYASGLMYPYRNGYQGIWLVQTRYAGTTDPNRNLVKWLEARSWDTRRYDFPNGQLLFFAVKEDRVVDNSMDQVGQWPDAFQAADMPIAEGVRLVGVTQPAPEIVAGDVLMVGLGWHIEKGAGGDYPVAIQVIGADGSEIASQPVTLSGRGDRDRYLPVEVFIPPGAKGGRAQIVLVSGDTWQPIDTVRIIRRAPSTEQVEIPADAQTLNIRLGEAITLAAVSLPDTTEFGAGEGIPLILYWRADGVIPQRYKVFMHLRGEAYDASDDSNIWGQQDQEPRNAARPTTSWLPDEIIADDYLIPIQADAPPGHYIIQIGLYLPLSGQRLLAVDSDGATMGDSIVIFEIDIVR
jgi:4-amino-4-deoxy-L-arabinose transferase-like glycosyltransferase